MEIINQFKDKVSVNKLLDYVALPESSYYYRSSNNKVGCKPSEYTTKSDGSIVENSEVVKDIKYLFTNDFYSHGYRYVNEDLKSFGYIINNKKTYRLMLENKLLFGKIIPKPYTKRKFVKYRKIKATRKMEYLCMDIKYIYADQEKRFYYLFSVEDIYSRMIIGFLFQPNITKHDVKKLFEQILGTSPTEGITIRNDNGSQFIATMVREYFAQKNITQEFTHIATPEENSYIEAYHSVLQKGFVDRFELLHFHQIHQLLIQWVFYYNFMRRHSSIKYLRPAQLFYEQTFSFSTLRRPIAGSSENKARLFNEIFFTPKNNKPKNISLKIPFSLDYFSDDATFAYVMANEKIANFIWDNSQTFFKFAS